MMTFFVAVKVSIPPAFEEQQAGEAVGVGDVT